MKRMRFCDDSFCIFLAAGRNECIKYLHHRIDRKSDETFRMPLHSQQEGIVLTFKRFDNRQHTARPDHEDISPDQFREMTPLEVAGKYLEHKGFSSEKTREYVSMMDQVIKQMNAEIP